LVFAGSAADRKPIAKKEAANKSTNNFFSIYFSILLGIPDFLFWDKRNESTQHKKSEKNIT
jgi:hypothetical protein